ncbi:MAG: hypothetical protein CMJ18_03590 [Phycisphaeraceae bacterium]|nr:hypothetical protein [Phycisphaeraceae bacterium]
MSRRPTVVFAGGGSGGHIYPNLAICERLLEIDERATSHFLVSTRAIDHRILATPEARRAVANATHLPVMPPPRRPDRIPAWIGAWRRTSRLIGPLIRRDAIDAVIATGGFVSVPAVRAARRAGVPVALVNLDAVPGRANRWMARTAGKVFSACDLDMRPDAERISLPLRRAAVDRHAASEARARLGLQPDLPTLLVCGGSQGARSVNAMMEVLAGRLPRPERGAAPWQVLHLTGEADEARLREAYRGAGRTAVVMAFLDEMGLAWSSADLAISRAGASSVAEVRAHGVPTIFMPYPHHRDRHQWHNAAPLVDAGGAVVVDDVADPEAGAVHVLKTLEPLMADNQRRDDMSAALRRDPPPDAAMTVARWAASQL